MPSLPFAPTCMARLRSWLARPWAALRREVRPAQKRARSNPAARPRVPRPTPQQLVQMQAALRRVLDHHPDARQVFPALAAVERVLPAGPRAFERLPTRWLRHASTRLEVLAGDWSSEGLRQLREYLRRVCEVRGAKTRATTAPPARPATPARPAPPARPVRPMPASQPEVSETSISRFMEASELMDLEPAPPAATSRGRTPPRD